MPRQMAEDRIDLLDAETIAAGERLGVLARMWWRGIWPMSISRHFGGFRSSSRSIDLMCRGTNAASRLESARADGPLLR